jgi:alkanesulfonate monooxygenase SsuD/methylene tetrahydromethanopterin reductase-like flavin-dependent oxidoreductase (luciferase family)
VLSGGRLEFGVGRGATPIYFAGYNVPQEESRERFEESLQMILHAWTDERLTYQGKHFQVKDLPLAPRPLQKPHPPIRIAANSPDTFAIAGQLGLPIFASPLINPPDKRGHRNRCVNEIRRRGASGRFRLLAFRLRIVVRRKLPQVVRAS